MSKRERRLWLGDWQRDPDSDQADRFVVLPDDDGATAPPDEHRRGSQRAVAALGAIAVLLALTFALTSGGHHDQFTSADAPRLQAPQAQQPQLPQTPQAPQGGGGAGGFGGPDLTGPAAIRAAKAALAQFPGGIERVTAGPGGGGYVVHVFQAGGCEVHVVVSGGFKVLGSDAGAGGCGNGFAPAPQTAPRGGSTN